MKPTHLQRDGDATPSNGIVFQSYKVVHCDDPANEFTINVTR
ncbi:hypothetical protein [Kitasatospora purpeofusca]|uniref:Uncharacterized protein n=1 Tax=Kitasatospora purpeofusca TaxID=67352 RepID=A0ABZ1TV10_9ACTN|nr:hypothetical protein [Kitasatospora purpeofusca]